MSAAFYRVEPVTDFSIFTTPPAQRKGVQFKATWSTTLEDLGRELDHLDAHDIVLEVAVDARDIRKDGMLRADARPRHPGVRLSFQSTSGALSFTCDTYEQQYYSGVPSWQANVRAIAKTLERLRDIDRYGATKGEQYAGFKAIGAGSGATPLGGMTRDQALAVLDYPKGETFYAAAFRRARANAHPDRNGGDQTQWDRVEEAGRVLGISR